MFARLLLTLAIAFSACGASGHTRGTDQATTRDTTCANAQDAYENRAFCLRGED